MNRFHLAALVATVLLGTGLALVLPRRSSRGQAMGAVMLVVSLALFGTLGAWIQGVPVVGGPFAEGVLLAMTAVTLASAIATIAARNPVYSAIWFALTLLSSSGLFLFQGAQFLSLATVTVYAGAILVMFLFVLMLANPSGRAYYDRVSWEPLLSAATGAALVGILTVTLATVLLDTPREEPHESPATAMQREGEVLASEHMAHLGRRLFADYLLAVEGAGALLMVALVGAVAILLPDRQHQAMHPEGPAHE